MLISECRSPITMVNDLTLITIGVEDNRENTPFLTEIYSASRH